MLYTGKGDNGTTRVFGCEERISKASDIPEALGALDELNSFVGFCKVKAKSTGDPEVILADKKLQTSSILRAVQENLFILQAEVAGAPKSLGKEKIEEMEKMVKAIEQQIPPITTFLIAGGTELSALLDVAPPSLSKAKHMRTGSPHSSSRLRVLQTMRQAPPKRARAIPNYVVVLNLWLANLSGRLI